MAEKILHKKLFAMELNNKNLLTLDGNTALVVVSLEDEDDTVVVVVAVVILWALKALREFGMNDPCDIVLLLAAAKSVTLDGGSCEFLPYSTYYNSNKM